MKRKTKAEVFLFISRQKDFPSVRQALRQEQTPGNRPIQTTKPGRLHNGSFHDIQHRNTENRGK